MEARFRYPHDVAIDGWGSLYIADKNNHRIRRIDPSGIITTVAGNGTGGHGGDGGLGAGGEPGTAKNYGKGADKANKTGTKKS